MTLEALMHEIRALPVDERKRLLDLIADTLPESVRQAGEKQHDIMEFRGLGAEIWQGIDAQEYVNRLRDEWDKPR